MNLSAFLKMAEALLPVCESVCEKLSKISRNMENQQKSARRQLS